MAICAYLSLVPASWLPLAVAASSRNRDFDFWLPLAMGASSRNRDFDFLTISVEWESCGGQNKHSEMHRRRAAVKVISLDRFFRPRDRVKSNIVRPAFFLELHGQRAKIEAAGAT